MTKSAFSFAAYSLLSLAGAATLSSQNQPAPQWPEGSGKEVAEKLCGATCHGPDKVFGSGGTPEDWTGSVAKMVERGAKMSDAEYDLVLEYLVQNFPALPKVNLNKATAGELEKSLGFTAKEAEAIVRHREQNGAFKGIADLRKVPGLDAAKLETKKTRFAYQ